MKRWLAIFGVVAIVTSLSASSAYAEPSLRLEPLQYQETLQKGERKQGFIEVTNPSLEAAQVSFKVNGFRQMNNQGALSFYDDERLRQGVQLDVTQAMIPGRQTFRLAFVVDSSKLPAGDVFAVIFAQTSPVAGAAAPSVQLGTLLLLTNGTPGIRRATVTDLQAPWLQLGTAVEGQLTIKNTAPPSSASGFFPQVTISLWPFGPSVTTKGPLVYAGNSRTMSFRVGSNQLGIYRLSAAYGTSHKDQWVVVATGVWRWLGLVGLLVGVGGVVVGLRWYRRRHPTHRVTA